MPTWWGGKSHSKEGNKRSKESIVSTIQRKLRNSEDTRKCSSSTRSGLQHNAGISKAFLPHVQSQSEEPLPTHVSGSSTFIDTPNAQPLPLPLPIAGRVNAPSTPTFVRLSNPKPYSPFQTHENLQNEVNPMNNGCDPAMVLSFSDRYTDSEDLGDSHPLSPQPPDYEIGGLTPMRSQSRVMMKKNQPFYMVRNESVGVTKVDQKEKNRSKNTSHSHQIVDLPLPNLQIPQSKVLTSVPDSLNSSPSRSPLRVSAYGLYPGTSPCPDASLMGSGHCSSPGSVYNSGHNSVGGDLLWQNTRCSPDYSAIPSPIVASSSSSRAQSGTVSPLHPRAGGTIGDPNVNCQDDKKQRSHRLPLPPITISRTSTFSPSYSGATSPSPSIPRSPVMVENFTNFGSHWKKGRMIGGGTFGHVYLGFNSESGEMCAMKEVTLLSDDLRSKESVHQLLQELSLLGRLRHPNIVQHYGSGMINDKLYIYLEYVSGGSIHRLLQEYGQFGETAIRNYTHQILSGLAYLHSKNTVHRFQGICVPFRSKPILDGTRGY